MIDMENNFFSRTSLMLSSEDIKKLNSSRVLLFGLGGVGAASCEALARAGIGKIGICDGDVYEITNMNRQLYATKKSLGKAKTDVAYERIKDIRDIDVIKYTFSYNEETKDNINFKDYDFIIDAIDNVSSKLLIIERAREAGVKIISSMGTGNKLDPTKFEVDFIENTSIDPLAKIIRKKLKEKNIRKIPVVYSKEEPIKTSMRTPGSVSFVPPVSGFILASYVVRNLLDEE
ncbi:tRNA threonylcarbamoyladenosine dehydratase [uncultured Peptoniphilus sp.]|uniref:tRNA threonylcarbamoyladenosine dehydratase n=1 Tax=uncultured Peptoniphilus sp. TaxID=254354 RepID=UPI0028043F48|nr:tRNA threonylcarbamoyladenosine dehydratase [uncultured Peptoniphilus sp.]